MGRHPRYIPPNALVEVTNRTLQGRLLLRPSKALNLIVLGVLGRAQRRYEIHIHAVVVMSNHYHMLLSPPDAKKLADFMGFFNSNLSKEVGKLHGWQGPMWQRRYDSVIVSEEEAAQVSRLRYLLSHGCKENLVFSPKDWPGVQSVNAIVDQEPLNGLWFDRTNESKIRRQASKPENSLAGIKETVALTPLPAWAHHSSARYRELVAELTSEIQNETIRRHQREGSAPLGAHAVERAHPLERPRRLESRPKPSFHASTRRVRQRMTQHFSEWLAAYRRAAESLRAGNLKVEFPQWSFPPPQGWVGDGGFEPD